MSREERDNGSWHPGREALARLAEITCYLVEKDPRDEQGWRAYAQQSPDEARSLGVLFLCHLACDECELRKVLASLPPDCGFTVTQLDHLQEGERCRGEKRDNTITIDGAGPLAAVVRRFAPEPVRSRLIQRWNAQYLAQLGPLNALSAEIVELGKAEQPANAALARAFEGIARAQGIQQAYERAISALVALPTLQGLLDTIDELQGQAGTPVRHSGGDELERMRAYLGEQARQGEHGAYADIRGDVCQHFPGACREVQLWHGNAARS